MPQIIPLLLHVDWNALFVPTVSVLEKILRHLLVYFALVGLLRILGKRELAQINSFDIVVLLLLSNSVQNAVIGNDDSVSGGIIGAITLLAANYLVARFFFKHQKLEEEFEGRPELFILGGRVNPKALRRELITIPELETAARKQGIGRLDEVERAEIDPDGQLFFVKKEPRPEESRHAELMAELKALRSEVEALKGGERG